MKKLMIAAAIVCAAAMSQAATVNWAISDVQYGGGAPTAGWSVMAFYTEVGAGTADIVSAINSKTASTLSFDNTKSLSVSFSKGKVAAHDINVPAIVSDDQGNFSNYDFYFVVFNNADASQATEYALVSAPNTAYSGVDTKFKTSASFSGASWNTISAVPEPTSGLLLLLGVAGLALRRKRA